MRKFFTPILCFLTVVVSAQTQIWKNYFAQSEISSIIDLGNSLAFIQNNELVQFDKTTHYFNHTRLASYILSCKSLHQSRKMVPSPLSIDNQQNIWLSITNFDDDTISPLEPGYTYKFNGATWSRFDDSLLYAGYEPNLEVHFDALGNRYFASPSKGLIKLDDSGFTHWDSLNSPLKFYDLSDMQFDSTGNLWAIVAGGEKVMKFDGNHFTFYDATALHAANPQWAVFDGLYVNRNQVFVTTQAQTPCNYYQFNDSAWSAQTLDSIILGASSIEFIFFDDSANIYFSTSNSGLIKYNGHEYTLMSAVPTNIGRYISYALTDAYGTTWFTAQGRLFALNGEDYTEFFDPINVLNSNTLLAQLRDNQGRHWLSYADRAGLSRITPTGPVAEPAATSGGYPIVCLTSNAAGQLFYATEASPTIYRYDAAQQTTASFNCPGCGSLGGSIEAISIDRSGKVCAVGADVLDGSFLGCVSGSVFSKIGINATLNTSDVFICLTADSSNNFWIGTVQGGNYPNTTGLIKHATVPTFYTTSNSGIPDNNVQCLAVDAQNRLWVGTYKGLAIYDGATWKVYDSTNSPLPSNHIEDIRFDNGLVYISTQFKGFAIWNGLSDWQVFTPLNSGLADEDCESTIFDSDCNLWIATECGLTEMVGNCGSDIKILHGKVLDENGNALANMPVNLLKYGAAGLAIIDNTTSDGSGNYGFATSNYSVFVQAAPWGPSFPTLFPTYGDSAFVQQSAAQITMYSPSVERNIICKQKSFPPGEAQLHGTIFNDGGGKAADVRIYLVYGNQPVARAVSNIDGTFKFENIAEGYYSVWVDRMGINNMLAPAVYCPNGIKQADFALHSTWLELLTLSAEQVDNDNSIGLFPNPASTQLSVHLAEPNMQIKIWNTAGTALITQKPENQSPVIDLAGFANGIYILEAISATGSFKKRFVVTR